VIVVERSGREVPFSRGIVTQSLLRAGMDVAESVALARAVRDRLRVRAVAELGPHGHLPDHPNRSLRVSDGEVAAEVRGALLASGHHLIERRVRVRRWIRDERRPFVLAVGGTSGVGKSTVSEAAAARLGIGLTLSTDLVRSVIRSVLHPELLPTLHQSSFSAAKMLKSNLSGSRLQAAYEQQARIVQQGTVALAQRAVKEGMQTVINGVHVVPGLLEIPADLPLFTYVITVPDPAEHQARFVRRFLAGDREPSHYLERLDAIRELDGYVTSHCRKAGVPVIESTTFDGTVSALVDAICQDIERHFPDACGNSGTSSGSSG
jgi:2-phosphoglycerate kinase